jgi:hypothetical protein
VCWCHYLKWNHGWGKTRKERLKGLKINNGVWCHKAKWIGFLRLKHRFGWLFTICLCLKTQIGNMRSLITGNRTCWGWESIWMRHCLINCRCLWICWEHWKNYQWWERILWVRRIHSLFSRFLKWERESWKIGIGRKLLTIKSLILSHKMIRQQRKKWKR